jgi:hypothetical protein
MIPIGLIKKNFCIALLISIVAYLSLTPLGNVFVLGDRNRYLASQPSSYSLFDRTALTDSIFSLSPIVEPLLLFANIYFCLKLCSALTLVFSLSKIQKVLLYIACFLPFRLLFRSYASKELLFSLAAEILIILLVTRPVTIWRQNLSFNIKILPSILALAIISILLLCLLLRPFYAILLFMPILASVPIYRASRVSRKRFLAAAVVLSVFILILLLYTPGSYETLVSFMTAYFLVDGASASSTRIGYQFPSGITEFILVFLRSSFQSLIGPTYDEIMARPFLVLVSLEGLILTGLFLWILSNMYLSPNMKIMSAPLSSAIALALLYLLFVFYIFSSINYMGGIRYQSASMPIILYLYSLSCGIKNRVV